MRTVGIFGKAGHPDVQMVAQKVAELVKGCGCEVLMESAIDGRQENPQIRDSKEVAAVADLVVVLGGDGTMLRVIHTLDEREVPVVGVNLGFLGYLTEFTVEEAQKHLPRILSGSFETVARVKLIVDLIRDGKQVVQAKVLNDVVLSVGGISRIIEIRAEINGEYVTTYRADGLIVSTPTGSTAYSLSAGGPIVHPTTRALVVAPICPHTLTMRPLVVQDDARVSLRVERFKEAVYVTFDGQFAERIYPKDRVEIQKAPTRVLLVRPPSDYFQVLRAKLKWG